jgi:anti-sigma B factor antagonist
VRVAEFSVRPTTEGDACVVAVTGELDAQTAPELTTTASAGLDAPETHQLVLDLSEVTFIDSTGIAALVRLRRRTLDAGKRLLLRNPGVRVVKVLEITALNSIFDIE